MSERVPASLTPTAPARAPRSWLPASRRAWLRARWARARELVPCTLRGLAVAGLSLAALLFYGFGALDGVWYVVGLGLLALCGLALCAVLLAALTLKLALRRAPAAQARRSAETGQRVDTGFVLPSFWLFVLVEIELTLRAPSAAVVDAERMRSRLHEHVRFGDYGEVRGLARTIFVRDVFGLASLGLRQDAPVEIDVLPHAGALRSLPLLRSLSGGDDVPHPLGLEQGDRLELRRYAPGDPARFIHWKVYARTQKLVVRMPERALSRAQRVAAYLVAGPRDAASAAAARVALEEGAFGSDFRFAADGSPKPVRELASALVAIRRAAAARDHAAEGLAAFMKELEREGPTSLVLFVPAAEGEHVARIGQLVQKRGHSARVVIGVDGVAPESSSALWTRLTRIAFVSSPSARVEVATLRALLTRYRRYGCEVVVVDRASGRVLGEAHLGRAAAREVAA